MDHIAAAEEQIVSERIRRKLEEVNAAAQSQLSPIQDHINFTLQTYPPATEKEAEAVTTVWWDINRCPVPDDVNPRLIGPFIKRSLKELGYSGPLTITAIGTLTEVDNDVLKALWTTGVALYHIPTDDYYPPPANLMVISRLGFVDGYLERLSGCYYNILSSIDAVRPKSIRSGFTRSDGCYLWENFLANIRSPTPFREPPLPEPEQWRTMAGPALFCGSCELDLPGFQSLANHLCSKEHALKDLYHQPCGGPAAAWESKGMDADAIRGALKRLRETPRKIYNSLLEEYEDED